MAISTDGDFQDEEQFKAFGKLIKEMFGKPVAINDGGYLIELQQKQKINYIVIREDIANGQRIRAFKIMADGESVYESKCIGHKRIVPFNNLEAKKIELVVTEDAGDVKIRDIAIY